jgi:hypothetical protein
MQGTSMASPLDFAEPVLPPEEFWDRYNRRFEFPLSTVLAVALHAVAAALLIVILFQLTKSSPSHSGVPLVLIDPQGVDDEGDGSPGAGKQVDDPVSKNAGNPLNAARPVPPASDIAKIEAAIRNLLDDPNTAISISPDIARDYRELDETLRRKLLPKIGSNKGTGTGEGKGFSTQSGDGPSGVGASSAQARSLRWVLRFTTSDGPDYVHQLAVLGAVILVPFPPANKGCLYFPDLKRPAERRQATEDDLKKLAGQVRFSDGRADSVRGVCQALHIKENATTFWAFFPKKLEEELAKKEIGFANLRPEEIQETAFRITVRNGNASIAVEKQVAKK